MSDEQHEWKVGEFGLFAGYKEDGVDAILSDNAPVKVVSIAENGNLNVAEVDAETGEFIERDGERVEDQLWPAELTPAVFDEEDADIAGQEADAEQPATEPAKSEENSSQAPENAEENTDTEPDIQADTSSQSGQNPDTDLLEEAKVLADQAETAYFRLGGILLQIKEIDLHTDAGYSKEEFASYVNDEVGVDYRKAQYLMNIYTFFTNLGMGPEELRGIGWSKAKEISRIKGERTEDEIRAVIEDARSRSRDEVGAIVTQMNGGTDAGTAIRRTTLKFVLAEENGENAKRVLSEIGSETGITDPSQQFEMLVTEYQQMKSQDDLSLEDTLAFLEAKFDISISYEHNDTPQTDEEDQEQAA